MVAFLLSRTNLPTCAKRKGFDGLAAQVEHVIHDLLPRLPGCLFVFRNERRDRMKLLWWDRDG